MGKSLRWQAVIARIAKAYSILGLRPHALGYGMTVSGWGEGRIGVDLWRAAGEAMLVWPLTHGDLMPFSECSSHGRLGHLLLRAAERITLDHAR